MTAETATETPAETAPTPSPWPIAEAALASLPGLRYLWLSPKTGRPPTEIEQEKYEARRLRDDWAWLFSPPPPPLAAQVEYMAPPPVIAVSVVAPTVFPVPAFQVSTVPPLPSPAVPVTAASNQAADRAAQVAAAAPGSVADLAAERLAEEAAAAQSAASAGLIAAWSRGQGEPSAEQDAPDATAVIPATSAETEAIPAVTDQGAGK